MTENEIKIAKLDSIINGIELYLINLDKKVSFGLISQDVYLKEKGYMTKNLERWKQERRFYDNSQTIN